MITGYDWYNPSNSESIQKDAVGKEISNVSLTDDNLIITFTDGTLLNFRDDGQSCCEYRYFSCDGDNLSEFVGAKYVEAYVKDAPDIGDDDYGVHEVCFLEVRTSLGSITVSAHNEHNGYYGGFGIVVS